MTTYRLPPDPKTVAVFVVGAVAGAAALFAVSHVLGRNERIAAEQLDPLSMSQVPKDRAHGIEALAAYLDDNLDLVGMSFYDIAAAITEFQEGGHSG